MEVSASDHEYMRLQSQSCALPPSDDDTADSASRELLLSDHEREQDDDDEDILLNDLPIKHHDAWAAVLFIACMIVFICLPLGFAVSSNYSVASGQCTGICNVFSRINTHASTLNALWVRSIVSIIASLGASGYYTKVLLRHLRTNALYAINASYFWSIALSLFAALVLRSFVEDPNAALLPFASAVLLFIAYMMLRRRLPLVAALLECAATSASKYPGLYITKTISIIVDFAVLIIFVFNIIMTLIATISPSSMIMSITFGAFVATWAIKSNALAVHTVACGVIAKDLLNSNISSTNMQTTAKSVHHVFRYSFGSVCLGALLITIANILRGILNPKKTGNMLQRFTFTLLSCFASVLLYALEFLNDFSMVHVALHGKPFCRAAKDTWSLLTNSGVDMLISRSVAGFTMQASIGLGGCVAAFVPFCIHGLAGDLILLHTRNSNEDDIARLTGALISIVSAYIVGVNIVRVPANVITSANTAAFVSLAVDATAVQRKNYVFWERLYQEFPNAEIFEVESV